MKSLQPIAVRVSLEDGCMCQLREEESTEHRMYDMYVLYILNFGSYGLSILVSPGKCIGDPAHSCRRHLLVSGECRVFETPDVISRLFRC